MNFGGMGYTTEDFSLKEIRYVTVRTSSCLQRLVGGGREEGGVYICNLKELRVNELKYGIPLFEFNLEREELYLILQRERETEILPGPAAIVRLCVCLYYNPPGSSAHGISQARILEQVAISCSRESS